MEILSIEDQEDGSAIMAVDLSHEELVAFAKIGLLQALKDSVAAVEAEQGE